MRCPALRRRHSPPRRIPDAVPSEVVDLIMLKMSTRDVARCRAVSREWWRILSSQAFLGNHARTERVGGAGEALLIFNFRAPGWPGKEATVLNVSSAPRSMTFIDKLKIGYVPAHVCNGFVLFARPESRRDPYIVFNPITGERGEIPAPPKAEPYWKMAAMGYIPSSKVYKAFRLTFTPSTGGYADVLTLRPGAEWRQMEPWFESSHAAMDASPALVDGHLYFLAKPRLCVRMPDHLLIINVAAETHRTCPLPGFAGEDVLLDVFDLHGQLCVALHHLGHRLEFWVLSPKAATWELRYWFHMPAAPRADNSRHSAWADDSHLCYLHGEHIYKYHHTTTTTTQSPPSCLKDWDYRTQLPLPLPAPDSPSDLQLNIFGGYHPDLMSPDDLDVTALEERDAERDARDAKQLYISSVLDAVGCPIPNEENMPDTVSQAMSWGQD